jgi:hypothetical protein
MWSFIRDFETIVFNYFNLKFCSKFVLFYMNYTDCLLYYMGPSDFYFWLFLHPLDELLYMDILKYYESWSLLQLTTTQNKTSNSDFD